MKIRDLNPLDNPDNLTVVYFSEDGASTEEDSLAELTDKVIAKLRSSFLPTAEEIGTRLVNLGIVLELSATPELNFNDIKLDYTFENINHAIWFNIDTSLSTELGYLTFTINNQVKTVYLRGEELKTGYINRGYYLIVYSKDLKSYNLSPILPKDLGFISTEKYTSGLFSDLVDMEDYNFLYVTKEYTGIIEQSLFYDLPESLLFNALSYTLKIIKTKTSDEKQDGYVEIYSIIREVPEGNTVVIPNENIFIPKNQAFYLYKN